MTSDKKMISLLKGILNATPDLIFAKDTSFTYLTCNEAFANFIQRPIEKVQGFKDEDFFNDAELIEGFREADKKILAKQKVIRIEEWVTFPNGEKILLDTLKTPFYDDEGNLVGLLGISRDITDRIMQEKQLIAAKEQAELATAAKSDFIAKISHEIRTPMNAIIGLSNLTLKTKLTHEQQDYAEKILYSGEALLGLINDILDFSKIEAGKLFIEKTPFSINEILENVININAINAHEKKLELITDIDQEIPSELIGDPYRLQQILINLVNNSIKFTEKGYVKIALEKEKEKETQNQIILQCSITDTGIGMSAKQQEHLFESFTQADNTVTRKYGGTGLGLTIAKELTELMGGEIHFKSTLDKGSTFTFTVLLNKSTSETPKQSIYVEGFKQLKVLVVDDSSIARDILTQILSQWCLTVEESISGTHAIETIQKAQLSRQPFDIVFMDWHMPEMDGIETSKRITDLNLDHSPQILMVSAFDKDEAKLTAQKNNIAIHQFIEKPVNHFTLSTSINNVLQNKPQQFITPKYNNDEYIPNFSTSKILIVEDNVINRQVACGLLQETQINIDIAENGLIALEKIKLTQYDLILMDIQMPEMDGLTATHEIRNKLKLTTLPIIAMTAHAMAADKEKSKQAGMNDHITKPLSSKQLFAGLLNYLEDINLSVITKGTVKNMTSIATSPIKFTAIEQIKNVPNLDPIQALENLGGKAELYLKLLSEFYKTQVEQNEELTQLSSNANWNELYRIIHTLKSNAAYIGAYPLSALCNQLEAELERKNYTTPLLSKVSESLAALMLNLQNTLIYTHSNIRDTPFSIQNLTQSLTYIKSLLESSNVSVDDELPALQTLVNQSEYEEQIKAIAHYILDVEYEKATKLINIILVDLDE